MQRGEHLSCVMSKLKRFMNIAMVSNIHRYVYDIYICIYNPSHLIYPHYMDTCYCGCKNRTNLGLCVSGSKSEVEFLPSIKGHPYKLLPSSATSSNAVGDNGREDPFRGTMLLLLLLRLF